MNDVIARALLLELREGREVELIATGQSMWPFVPSGSTVRITPGAALVVGGLGAFERDGRIVIHRVRRIEAAGVRFMGDLHDDETVAHARVLGAATVVVRRRLRVRIPRPVDAKNFAASLVRRALVAVSSKRFR